MIRFRRLFDVATGVDRRQVAEFQAVFRKSFPYESAVADRIPKLLTRAAHRDFELIVLIAEDERSRVLGFTVTFFFRDVRYAYLQYIASDPARRARGIGGALYEATRELLTHKGGRGLFFDVPTDDAAKVKDPSHLAINRRRLEFYERYGAFPISGTLYDVLPNPANEGNLVFLVYDPLGRTANLARGDARKAVRHIMRDQYGYHRDNAYVREVIESFRDNPVRLRPPRYVKSSAEAAPPVTWLRPIKLVVTEGHQIHHLREKGYVERPVRVRAVLRGLEGLPCERRPARRFGAAPIRAVHDPGLVSYLANVCARLDADTLLYPEVFPIRRPERRPRALESRAGYFCIDTFTPLTRNAYTAARAAVDSTLSAAELLLGGERLVYALVRPPGHHAERAVFGGFCYFNNAAIAAHWLSGYGRGALLDIDYHHGNGSQDIFYRRGDVLTLSIHGHPNISYPHFSGFADERGEGAGLGRNRNYPLREGVDDARYLDVLDDALSHVRRFKPEWLVVSLGYDIMRGDPTGTFLVTVRGMRRIAERLGRLGLPTLVVQEGGYSMLNLRHGARAFITGIASTWY